MIRNRSISDKVCTLLLVAAMLGFSKSPLRAGASVSGKSHPSCATREYRQFDFWIGDWDVFDIGGAMRVARAKVDRLLDGCVLREEYNGSDGHQGESLTIYDISRSVWHQSWFTNRGELLVIEGALRDGQMTLTGKDRADDGRIRLVRGIWKPQGDSVRETAATSLDGGKTWQPWFDLIFRPHR